MAKQQNTYAKRSREMEKKRKADQKRERRAQRKQEGGMVRPESETNGEDNPDGPETGDEVV